jgi:hypothetical protein
MTLNAVIDILIEYATVKKEGTWLSIYKALMDLDHVFSFLICTQSVGLLGWGSARL